MLGRTNVRSIKCDKEPSILAGNPNQRESLNPVGLLIKTACSGKKKDIFSVFKVAVLN
jgi:hypothetical protein